MLCALLSTGGLLRKGLGVVSVIERSSRRVAEPSWGRVLATTVKLSVSWRLRAIGFGPGRPVGRLARNPFRLPAGQQHRPIAGRWRLATLLLALALVAAAALRVTGVFAAATPAVTGVAVPDETGTHPSIPPGGGPLSGRRLDRRPGERQLGHRLLSRHVCRAAGAGRHAAG